MENKAKNLLVRHAAHIIKRQRTPNELSERQNILAAYALIAKINSDENAPEEVADFIVQASANLIAIMASMPIVSLSPLDFTTAKYDDLLTQLSNYVNTYSLASDMEPYYNARDLLREIYDALDEFRKD